MLSRVAERVYWLGRYLERAESTTRLVGVNTQLMLDLPEALRPTWRALLDITGAAAMFDGRFQRSDERNVTRFLLTDGVNPGSVLSALYMARENARTAREIIPSEAWEQINELYLQVRDQSTSGVARGRRFRFLQEVVTACQLLTGLMMDSMRHDEAYRFYCLGRSLERADMTTRILDVGADTLLGRAGDGRDETALSPYEPILWMNVLRSLGTFQSYTQHVQDRVNAEDVLAFLLQDALLPRAVAFCMEELERNLQALPHAEAPLRTGAHAKRRVREARIDQLMLDAGLHDYIDELQLAIAEIHNEIAATWFLPVPEPQRQEATG